MIWTNLVVHRRCSNAAIAKALEVALDTISSAIVVSDAIEHLAAQAVFCLRSDIDSGPFGSELSVYTATEPAQSDKAIQSFANSLNEPVIVPDDDTADPYAMRLFDPHRPPRRVRLSEAEFDNGSYVIASGPDALAFAAPSSMSPARIVAPGLCPATGYWVTPAQLGGRRRFDRGELMPEVKGDFGTTVWQWDEHQN